MFGRFKDKRFLSSGLKEGCSGLTGTDRSRREGARRKWQQLSGARLMGPRSPSRLGVC